MEHCCFDFDCKFRLYSENKSPTVGKKSLISRKSAFWQSQNEKKVSLTETAKLTFSMKWAILVLNADLFPSRTPELKQVRLLSGTRNYPKRLSFLDNYLFVPLKEKHLGFVSKVLSLFVSSSALLFIAYRRAYGLLTRNISICLLNTSIMVCSCGWSRFTMSAM